MRAGFDPDNMTVTVHSRVLGHLDWGSSDPRHHRLTNDDLLDIYAKVQQRVVHGLSRGKIKRSLSDSSGDTRRQSTVKLKSTKNQRHQPPICEIKHVQITDDSPNGSYAAFARVECSAPPQSGAKPKLDVSTFGSMLLSSAPWETRIYGVPESNTVSDMLTNRPKAGLTRASSLANTTRRTRGRLSNPEGRGARQPKAVPKLGFTFPACRLLFFFFFVSSCQAALVRFVGKSQTRGGERALHAYYSAHHTTRKIH